MKIRSPLFARLVAALVVATMRVLFRTCRVQPIADASGINAYESTGSQRYLYCVWHDQIIMTVFAGRPLNMAGLVSRHHDGSYVADTIEMCGIKPVRGSTRHGGSQAMRQLIDTARDYHIAITPDGPRGPRRELKDGIVFLASHSGRAIVPSAYQCRRCWKIRGNWTDMIIPKPFTKIVVRGGAPLQVPPDLSREQLAAYRDKLQAEMDRLDREAEQLARGGTQEPPELRAAA